MLNAMYWPCIDLNVDGCPPMNSDVAVKTEFKTISKQALFLQKSRYATLRSARCSAQRNETRWTRWRKTSLSRAWE